MPLKETTFIARNAEIWRRLERELDKPKPDPDVLRDLYAGVSDDLSYARTHYPNRSVRSYLNHQAAMLDLSLMRNEQNSTRFAQFWLTTVPLEIYEQRRPLMLALVVFLLAFAIGWGSSVTDPDFPRSILGDGYVDATLDNIAAGDPMAVYKGGSRLGGTLGIAGNNLQVTLLCFVSGILAGLGTLFVVLYNGIMVGAFQQFFFAQGVGFESVLGIWTHGTIEISCIVVAAGAGFTLAKGLVWPGTLSRSRSFQLSALSGLRIIAGIAPLIITAAIIEGFLTRLTDVPTILRILFLALNVLFVVYYFIVRPIQIGKHTVREEADYARLPPDRQLDWREHEIKGTAEVFFDSLRHYAGKSGSYLALSMGLGLAIAASWIYGIAQGYGSSTYYDENFFGPDISALIKGMTPPVIVATLLMILLVMPLITMQLHKALPGGPAEYKSKAATLVGLAIPWVMLALAAWLYPGFLFVAVPFCALWMRGITYHAGHVGVALADAGTYASKQILYVLGLAGMLLLAQLGFGLLQTTLWTQFVVPFIELNIPPAWSNAFSVRMLLDRTTDFTYLIFTSCLWTLAYGLLYHTLRERTNAESLRIQLEKVFPS